MSISRDSLNYKDPNLTSTPMFLNISYSSYFRFLLQKRLDPLTRHADSTTESNDLEPFVDKSPSLSEDNLIQDIQKRMPNLPIVYWNKNKNKPMGFNNTCAR